MTAANFAALSGNVGGRGSGGQALGGGSTGASVAAVNNIFNDGGTVNTAYAPAPSATIVVANSAEPMKPAPPVMRMRMWSSLFRRTVKRMDHSLSAGGGAHKSGVIGFLFL